MLAWGSDVDCCGWKKGGKGVARGGGAPSGLSVRSCVEDSELCDWGTRCTVVVMLAPYWLQLSCCMELLLTTLGRLRPAARYWRRIWTISPLSLASLPLCAEAAAGAGASDSCPWPDPPQELQHRLSRSATLQRSNPAQYLPWPPVLDSAVRLAAMVALKSLAAAPQ